MFSTEEELQELQDLLEEHEATVATAESLTGGQLAVKLTATPGSSQTFLGGVVSYATRVKVDVLGVPEAVVEKHGVVSAECAREMALGVRRVMRSEYALSTTGVAGPADQEGKPPGTVFFGLAGPQGARAFELDLDGGREEIQEQTCREALSALCAMLRGEEPDVR